MALGEMSKVESQVEIIKLLENVDSHMRETVLERWRATKQASEDKEKTRWDISYMYCYSKGIACDSYMHLCVHKHVIDIN